MIKQLLFVTVILIQDSLSQLFGSSQPWLTSSLPNAHSSVRTVAKVDAPLMIAPKCFPETATAYFLPSPPSAPRITVLDANLKDIVMDIPITPTPTQSCNFPPSGFTKSTRTLPAPPLFLMLPDCNDDFFPVIRDRFSRLAESDPNTAKRYESTTNGGDTLPICNFDKELLDGFLTGLGL